MFPRSLALALVCPSVIAAAPVAAQDAAPSRGAVVATIAPRGARSTADAPTAAPVSACVNTTARAARIDSVVDGVLQGVDCRLGDRYYDFYAFTLPEQRAITIRAKAQMFYPRVVAFDVSSGREWGSREDEVRSGEVAMRIILPAGANAMAVTADESATTGPYTIVATSASEDAARCEEVWITRNVETHQRLQATDCRDPSRPGYHDAFLLFLWEGQAVTLSEETMDFIPQLEVRDVKGATIADALGGDDHPAIIALTAPATGYYRIAPSSAGSSVGVYSLTVSDGVSIAPWRRVSESKPGERPWQPAPLARP